MRATVLFSVLPLKIVDPVAAMVLGGGNISQRDVAHFLKQLGKADDSRRTMRCLKSHYWEMTESLK